MFLRRLYTGLDIFITPKAWDSLPLEGECWDSGGRASIRETKQMRMRPYASLLDNAPPSS